MAAVNAYTRRCCYYIRNKHFARRASFRCWCATVWVHVYVGGVQTGPEQELMESALSALMGLPGQAELPPWLAVTQRQSLTEPTISDQNTHTHTYTWRNELGFGEAKLFASKLQNFNSERITPESGLGTVAWAHNCSAAAVYLLKCERLIRPWVPWWDTLITCHWDLCCHYNFYQHWEPAKCNINSLYCHCFHKPSNVCATIFLHKLHVWGFYFLKLSFYLVKLRQCWEPAETLCVLHTHLLTESEPQTQTAGVQQAPGSRTRNQNPESLCCFLLLSHPWATASPADQLVQSAVPSSSLCWSFCCQPSL